VRDADESQVREEGVRRRGVVEIPEEAAQGTEARKEYIADQGGLSTCMRTRAYRACLPRGHHVPQLHAGDAGDDHTGTPRGRERGRGIPRAAAAAPLCDIDELN